MTTTQEFICKSGNWYRITPHSVGDPTNIIIFLIFDMRGELVQDISFNNGRWLLVSGKIEDWLMQGRPEDYQEIQSWAQNQLIK